jgi:NitT/TauT family transport system permease protein
MLDDADAIEDSEPLETEPPADAATIDGRRSDGTSEGGDPLERAPVRPADVLEPIAALAILVGCWAAVSAVLSVPSYLLPSPVAVASRLAENPGLYAAHALATLSRIVGGGAAGIAGGFAIAVAVVAVRPLRYALVPYLVTVRVLPKVAIAPLLLLSLGTGPGTAVLFVAVIAFFPMALSTVAGLERADRRYEDLLRSVDAGPVRSFVAVRLRFALPDVISGLKQSVTLSVVGAVVAEWVVVDDGLGALVLVASENLLTDVLLAALVVLCALGLGCYGLVALLERRLCRYDLPG